MAHKFRSISRDLHNVISGRALEIYLGSGAAEGRDLENWHRAEAEILRGSAGDSTRPAGCN